MLRLLHTADVHLGARHADLGDQASAQRERQFAAVLGAHGVPVTFVHCGSEAVPDV